MTPSIDLIYIIRKGCIEEIYIIRIISIDFIYTTKRSIERINNISSRVRVVISKIKYTFGVVGREKINIH